MNTKELRIALAGNPNSGKTTFVNTLTGAHHKVGNYPGVTVEKREGTRMEGGKAYHFIDLPGIYSLTAYSLDEVVARDFILDEKPDLIVDVMGFYELGTAFIPVFADAGAGNSCCRSAQYER